jgi:hypothetical protein
MTDASDRLDQLARGFRQSYLLHDELTAQLQAWAKAFPDLVRLRSIGKSPEGRDLWLMIIGRDPDALRPAAWVDGNMHATEVCGSSVALAIAEDTLRVHAGGAVKHLSSAATKALRDVHLYVLPRMSPDGAEAVLKTRRYVRSSPLDARQHKQHARWESRDLDGDGRVSIVRQRCDEGELAELPGFPGVLVPRLPDDDGPFYKVYPEGVIANFDGRTIPDPHFLADNQYDFNRNFPYTWAPEPEQEGAGDYPGSTPETKAVLDFVTSRPNIYAWINLHTFGGVVIRPLGHSPDSKMNQGDLAIFRQVEEWAKELTTYPTVSGYHEFLYEPESPLRGDLTDFAYHQRGAVAYVVELWDLFRRIGMEVKKPFVDHYSKMTRKDFVALATFDRDVNKGRIFRPWTKLTHPQLGDVEVGGLDGLVGISNPPYELLPETCEQHSAAYLRLAALLPRPALEVVAQERLAAEVTRVTVRVVNKGYLSTVGLPSAAKLPHVEPLRLDWEASAGVEVEAPATGNVSLGHLEGWGQGLHGGASIFLPWSRGNVHEKFVSVVTRGRGTLKLRVSSCRGGEYATTVEVGG